MLESAIRDLFAYHAIQSLYRYPHVADANIAGYAQEDTMNQLEKLVRELSREWLEDYRRKKKGD